MFAQQAISLPAGHDWTMIKYISTRQVVSIVGWVKTAVQTNLLFQVLLLAVVTFLAAVLRFYMLGEWGFWGDEYITVERSQILFDLSLSRRSPSLIGTYLAFNQFGVSEWAARLVPAIFGVVTVPVFYWLARKLVDTKVALLACLLLSVNPWHIYWSQNARFYTALLLFYTLSLLLFYLGIEEDKPWYLVLSSLFFALALSERLMAAFLMPVTVFYMTAVKFGPFQTPPGWRWRNILLFFVPSILGLFSLIFLNPSVQNPERGQSAFGFVNNNPLWILGGVVFYLGVPLACMALVGAFTALLRANRLRLFLAIGTAVPFLSVMLVSLVLYSANRYVFVALTSIVLLAAIAIRELMAQNNSSLSTRVLVGGMVLVLLVAPMEDNLLYYRYQNGNRDNWKAAFEYIETHLEEGDQVVTSHKPLADYYLQQETLGMQVLERTGLAESLPSDQRVWIVLDLTALEKGPTVSRWARNQARLVRQFDVYFSARLFPMEVYLYDPQLAGPINAAADEK